MSLGDFNNYIKKINPEIKDTVSPHLQVIVSSMKNNPSRLKRFLNNLSLQEGLLKNKAIQVTFSHLLYWNIIDYVYPSMRNDLKENPETLFTLKSNIQEIDKERKDKERWDITEEMLKKVPQSLQRYIGCSRAKMT